MALPVPNLDDRRFQDLVDEAKRLVQQRCPEWTDHNVSDPGVTLIELFAWMTDQVVYRLNRVPDRNYVKFLELIGVNLFPPTAARTTVTFWLAAPQPATVTINMGTQVATLRTDTSEAIAFATTEDLAIISCSLGRMGSMIGSKTLRDHGESLDKGAAVYAFSEVPQPDDAL
ncbi:MAG: putative baseplate assembly protein, partial [Chloroflexi bacterium]|nr:putative baseplate assembly protein [Chloroflexota bacterium]